MIRFQYDKIAQMNLYRLQNKLDFSLSVDYSSICHIDFWKMYYCLEFGEFRKPSFEYLNITVHELHEVF